MPVVRIPRQEYIDKINLCGANYDKKEWVALVRKLLQRRPSKSKIVADFRSITPVIYKKKNKYYINDVPFSLGKKIGEGMYGTVKEGKWMGETVAVKELKINSDLTNLYNFIIECVIGILLDCKPLKDLYGLPDIKVKPTTLTIAQNNGSVFKPTIIMEKVDGSIHRIPDRMWTQNRITSFICQMASIMYILETMFNFNHNDLHYGNIAYKKHRKPVDVNINIPGKIKMSFKTDITFYLIDFGFACISIGSAKLIGDFDEDTTLMCRTKDDIIEIMKMLYIPSSIYTSKKSSKLVGLIDRLLSVKSSLTVLKMMKRHISAK